MAILTWLAVWFGSDHDPELVKEVMNTSVNDILNPDLINFLNLMYLIFGVIMLFQGAIWFIKRKLKKKVT
jgi:hypothetical protein